MEGMCVSQTVSSCPDANVCAAVFKTTFSQGPVSSPALPLFVTFSTSWRAPACAALTHSLSEALAGVPWVWTGGGSWVWTGRPGCFLQRLGGRGPAAEHRELLHQVPRLPGSPEGCWVRETHILETHALCCCCVMVLVVIDCCWQFSRNVFLNRFRVLFRDL